VFETLNQTNRLDAAKRLLSFFVSVIVHAALIITFIIMPLLFLNTIQEGELVTFLIKPPDPPPPPSPPLPPQGQSAKHVIARRHADFREPLGIPDGIRPPDDELYIDAQTISSSLGYISPGLIGAQSDGIRALLKTSSTPPKPPEIEKPKVPKPPVAVVSELQQSKLVFKTQPHYPPLAVRARVSGTVILEVIVDEEGNVSDIKILKGHPLLNEAATSAVWQWKYSPTILNGEPVCVVATVNVVFNLR
jgi:periplasmic protein TonB